MKIVLDNRDLCAIAGLIAADRNERGTVVYDAGGVEITVEYSSVIDGYMENDYFNGTGAYIVTSAEVYIDDVYADVEAEVEYDERELVRFAELELAA